MDATAKEDGKAIHKNKQGKAKKKKKIIARMSF
jgi:hypothetical protein